LSDDTVTEQTPNIVYEDTGGRVPLVYFDMIGAYGAMNGVIEVEVATRILIPKPDGSTEFKFLCSGRLRCTPDAANALRAVLQGAMNMLHEPQPNPAATTKLN
jgi:hypothetical protein